MRWRSALLGMILMAAPGYLAATLVAAPEYPPPHAVSSPPDQPALPVVSPPRWDAPALASLSLLRRLTATEARRSAAALAACETRARRASSARRNAAFRRCATSPLARTNGFAAANSGMLRRLAAHGGPTRACNRLVMTLSGLTGNLAFSARSTLRSGLDAPWPEVLAASRSIRALAGETRRLARAGRWSSTCRARPPAPPRPPMVA